MRNTLGGSESQWLRLRESESEREKIQNRGRDVERDKYRD